MWLLSTFILYLSVVGIVKSTVDYLQHPVKSCHVGDVVENECSKCLCTSKAVFECTSLNCTSQSSHKELEGTEPLCFPNQLYVKNLITCICRKDGRWPHKSCHDTFQSLPPRTVITLKCEPNTYVPIDCNVCRCGPDGEIINDRCTRNACEDEVYRRSFATSTVFSKCEEKYWYSLAPCQFCFCANENRMVCNTGNYYNRNLDLGSYKLNVCGKDLIKEAIELIPDNLRTLRMRPGVTNTTKAKKGTKKHLTKSISNKMSEKHVMEINLNTKNKKPRSNTSNEHYFDESEAKQQKKQKEPEPTLAPTLAHTLATSRRPNFIPTTTDSIRSTQIPNDGSDMSAESEDITLENLKLNTKEELDVKTVEDDDDESVEIGMQLDQNPTTQQALRVQTKTDIVKPKQVYKYDGHTLNIDVPKALKKVFQIALRKSMVSLTRTTKGCTPGATTVHECNMCFCLKNNKLLCTTDKCHGRNKA